MAQKGKKKKVKLKLNDLLKGRSNADLHKDDPERRKNHLKYRSPRDELINSKGMEYTHALAADPVVDAKYNELVREFVNNGFDRFKAYAAVYGSSLAIARRRAPPIFASTGVRKKIREVLMGTDGNLIDELPKEYLIQSLLDTSEASVLDYIADDGTVLNINELKLLDRRFQKQIKKLKVHQTTIPVVMKDGDGNNVLDENGNPRYVEVKNQNVELEMYDRLRALELMGKAMRWITQNQDIMVTFLTPDMLMRANQRVRQLRREDIEGTSERVTTN